MKSVANLFGVSSALVSLATLIVCALVLVAIPSAEAQIYTVLYSFGAQQTPEASLVFDTVGNLYGTTVLGGGVGRGTVFELRPNGKLTILHRFTLNPDASNPYAGLLRDKAGNLYGTTRFGGDHDDGAVFKIDTTGTESVLHSFNGSDGDAPFAGLVQDKDGNLFGTTSDGGGRFNGGTVFKLDTTGTLTVLHAFGGSDGELPFGGLVLDKTTGSLFGTIVQGGADGLGIVFKLTVTGKLIVLHSFTGGPDGSTPYSSLVRDKAGNLYGTTSRGGDLDACDGSGCGVVFKLDKNGVETVLYRFTGEDGEFPQAGLAVDAAGNFYGTTYRGGAQGHGTVYKLDTTGKETVLHSFTDGADGGAPVAGLILDKAGNLYGTASQGGKGGGVVFKLTQ